MYSGGAAQSAPALNGSIKKASVPASHALHKDGGLKLPWYHLGSQHPRGHCLKTAAEFFLLTAGRFNGRTRRGLVLLLFVRAAPRPFRLPVSCPFPPAGLSGKAHAKAYSSLHSHFSDIAFIVLASTGFVNPLKQTFSVGN